MFFEKGGEKGDKPTKKRQNIPAFRFAYTFLIVFLDGAYGAVLMSLGLFGKKKRGGHARGG